jgi:hypothetical protein
VDDLIDLRNQYTRSIRRSLDVGIDELFFGLVGMVTAACFFVPHGGRSGWMFNPGLIPLILIAWVRLARKKINDTYIFPRTGYVIFRPTESSLWVEACVVAGALIVSGILLAFVSVSNVSGPLSALLIAGAFVWGGRFFRFPHLNWLAGFSLALGAATKMAGAKTSGLLWVVLGVSAALVVSGTIRFRIFLKTHPVMQEAQ